MTTLRGTGGAAQAATGQSAAQQAHSPTRTFPATPEQVPAARRFLARLIDDSTLSADALVCLSELVTNALQHSRSARPGGTFTVRATLSASALRVEVTDEGGPWQPRPDRSGQHGHGLLIVSQLTRAWGRQGDSGSGRTIWFEMDRS